MYSRVLFATDLSEASDLDLGLPKVTIAYVHAIRYGGGAEGKARVAEPMNCVVLCDECAGFCAVESITFPDKEQTKLLIQQLVREQHAREVAHD